MNGWSSNLDRKLPGDHRSEGGGSSSSLEWDWDAEHADRALERKADAAMHGATPFEVDRKLLRDVVREKSGVEVARIKFLSSGTFHKAYLVTLVDGVELVARVARRFMPRLKTESEVATLQYLRENTNVPVPVVFHYDSNPYNRLGGEYMLMSKAKGIPLTNVYHTLSYNELVKLTSNLAAIVIPLFAHRFSKLGSLYFGPDPDMTNSTTGFVTGSVTDADWSFSPLSTPTPRAVQLHYSAFPFSPTLPSSPFTAPKGYAGAHGSASSSSNDGQMKSLLSGGISKVASNQFHVGPIISWPFFGSNRGELSHPDELDRGPWTSTESYFSSCVEREVRGVIRENEGKAAPHKLHLDPDEIISSRHHHLKAVPGDESDESDEWDLEESEDEWEGPGDAMYRDYRRMQRSTFLLAHLKQREEVVKKEMNRWMQLMGRLTSSLEKGKVSVGSAGSGAGSGAAQQEGEMFGLDCHDLSLENIFVDANDPSSITCIIDWESTTTRPLWACPHLPAFLQSSPFTAKLFRDAVNRMANSTASTSSSTASTPRPGRFGRNLLVTSTTALDIPSLAREWLYYEAAGIRLRMAHRCVEWDGWEEGLVESILGPEEFEEDWFRDPAQLDMMSPSIPPSATSARFSLDKSSATAAAGIGNGVPVGERRGGVGVGNLGRVPSRKTTSKLPFAKELVQERVLNTTGDICGGRGGELGRRLEAWLTVNGEISNDPDARRGRWAHEEERENDVEIQA